MKKSTTKTLALLMFSSVVATVGCRRPAYQDVYVQNMASEIRELEDIIYEYDNEYRKLELELEAAKRENAMLKKMGLPPKNSSSSGLSGSTSSPSDRPTTPKSSAPKTDLESEKSAVEEPTPSPDTNPMPPPSTPLKSLESEETSPLKLEPTPAPPANEKSLPAPPASILPPPTGAGSGTKASEPGLLEPPDIDLGTPTDALPIDPLKKPPAESSKINSGTSSPVQLLPPPTLGALEVELGRIPKTASGRRRSGSENQTNAAVPGNAVSQASYSENSSTSRAIPTEETAQPLDQRMTEITFVRPFSIALDLDGQAGDDAVRLVLQPRNAAGEFLDLPAELMVSIIDPAIQDASGRIGIWKYNPQQVAEAMRKQGNAKGIHLDISLEGKVPAGKKVMVFVRYQTADGRRVENSHEYILAAPGDLESKWLPRANSAPRSVRGNGE